MEFSPSRPESTWKRCLVQAGATLPLLGNLVRREKHTRQSKLFWYRLRDVKRSLFSLRKFWCRRTHGLSTLTGLVALALSLTRQAQAKPDASRRIPFEWQAPPTCPDRSAVLARLASVDPTRTQDWTPLNSVRGKVQRESNGLRLDLEIDSQSGRKEKRLYRSHSCVDLAEAAALAIALLLDSRQDDEIASGAREEATSEQSERPTHRLNDTAAPAPELHVTRGPPIEVAIGVDGLLDPITLGNRALGATADLSLARGDVMGAVKLVWLSSADFNLENQGFATLGLMATGLRGCLATGSGLTFCAEAEMGRLRGETTGINQSRAAVDWWLSPGASLQLASQRIRQWAIRTRVVVMAPLIRPSYVVNQSESIHRIPAVSLRLAIGASWSGI